MTFHSLLVFQAHGCNWCCPVNVVLATLRTTTGCMPPGNPERCRVPGCASKVLGGLWASLNAALEKWFSEPLKTISPHLVRAFSFCLKETLSILSCEDIGLWAIKADETGTGCGDFCLPSPRVLLIHPRFPVPDHTHLVATPCGLGFRVWRGEPEPSSVT